MLKKIALLLLLIAPMSVFAQKFGHIKSADVLTVMPEFTKAQTDIQAMQKQYTHRSESKSSKAIFFNIVLFFISYCKFGLSVANVGN